VTPDDIAQTAEDLNLAQRQLQAIGVILAGLAFTLADEMKLKAEAAKAERASARRARKAERKRLRASSLLGTSIPSACRRAALMSARRA
jgi:hypothetical protein